MRANVKQAKRRECLPRDVSRHSIYSRYNMSQSQRTANTGVKQTINFLSTSLVNNAMFQRIKWISLYK